MANRISQEKAYAIASEYCTNGYNKVKALLKMGYTDTYANNTGLKVFDNERVLKAVARIQCVAVARTGYKVDECQAEFEEIRILAKEAKQYPAAVSAITGKARLHGYDKSNDISNPDTASTLTPDDIDKLREMARTVTDNSLQGPQLAKDEPNTEQEQKQA